MSWRIEQAGQAPRTADNFPAAKALVEAAGGNAVVTADYAPLAYAFIDGKWSSRAPLPAPPADPDSPHFRRDVFG